MPHVVILYTGNLESEAGMSQLCRKLADTMLSVRDEAGKQVFPTGGTRVYALPAPHFAMADGGAACRAAGGTGDYGFIYINLRMGRGRTAQVQKAAGDVLLDVAKAHVAPLMARRHLGLTLQIDESPSQVYDGKFGNLHSLFQA